MNRHSIDIIILRGAPGVGKSTLAKGLHSFFPHGAIIETDIIRQFLNTVDWTDRNESETGLEATLEVVDTYLKHGYGPVIIVSPFYTERMQYFLELIRKHHHLRDYFVISLFAEDKVLEERVTHRENGWNDLESCLRHNHDIQKHPVDNELVIDTTNFSDQELVTFVHQKLEEIL